MKNDIGHILKAKRTELGLKVSDVSKKIKIRDSFIKAIEKNDTAALPDSYYDLFLKKYADFLHVDLPEDEEKKKQKDMILEILTEENGVKKKDSKFKSAVRKALLFVYMQRKFFIAFIISLLLFLFIRHIYLILNEDEKSDKNESMVKIITIESDSVAVRDSFMIGEEYNEPFNLNITTLDSCYIYYFTDSLAVKEQMIIPGLDLKISAVKIIEAKLGNSSSVEIEFNENKVAANNYKDPKYSSAYIRVTESGVQKIKRSDRIGEYLKKTYGLDQ